MPVYEGLKGRDHKVSHGSKLGGMAVTGNLLLGADPLLGGGHSLLNIDFSKKRFWKMNIKFAKNLQFLEITFS